MVVGEPSALNPMVPLIYSWGNNTSGQLGHGDTWDQSTPKLVQTLPDLSVPLPVADLPPMQSETEEPPSPHRAASASQGIACGDWRLTETVAARASAPELRKMLQSSHTETARQIQERARAQSELAHARNMCDMADPVPRMGSHVSDEVAQLEQALGEATVENTSLQSALEQSEEHRNRLAQEKDRAERQAAALEGRLVALMDSSYATVCELEADLHLMELKMGTQHEQLQAERRATKATAEKSASLEAHPEIEFWISSKQMADEELEWSRKTIAGLEAKLAKLQASRGRGRSIKA
eukprot:TRINITY_DN24747_c0_g1_i1.p1 TRINITY_DN24747_c0_g1~~TRINITY_DN24747_c0_g1_i1.p1  ORF type:complete len:296 (-),score=75.51 TRINITY_DN24747_c0_g1_i1:238-1125(-)